MVRKGDCTTIWKANLCSYIFRMPKSRVISKEIALEVVILQKVTDRKDLQTAYYLTYKNHFHQLEMLYLYAVSEK